MSIKASTFLIVSGLVGIAINVVGFFGEKNAFNSCTTAANEKFSTTLDPNHSNALVNCNIDATHKVMNILLSTTGSLLAVIGGVAMIASDRPSDNHSYARVNQRPQ